MARYTMARHSTAQGDMAQQDMRLARHAGRSTAERADSERSSETALQLLRRLTGELQTLFRQEVALAGAEISRSLITLLVSLVSVATGGAVLYAGFVLLLVAAVFGLAYVLPMWLAAFAVGLVVALAGCILVVLGRNKLKSSELLPTRSPRSLRRDKD